MFRRLCCSCLPALAERLASAETAALKNIASMDTLSDIAEMIDSAVVDDPPFSVREGGIFRQGFSEELDYLRDVRDNGSSMLARLEARERERTGIKKLKVGYNKVFGYYIDVPKSAGEVNIPEEYIRKQTLVSNERYFTKELKELENTLINARDRIGELEYSFFSVSVPALPSTVRLFWIWKARTASEVVWPNTPSMAPS